MLGNYEIAYNPQHAKITSISHHICLITIIAGCLVPILIPSLHILIVYYYWCDNKRVINKNLCSCSCWDSIYKGPYESGVASYKHVYFNSTPNSFKIWTLTVLCVLLLYETTRWIFILALQSRVRYSMIILFVSAMFSHYYSWWMFFNYWNDDYYTQWYHQLFFTLTELASSVLVLLLMDRLVSFSTTKAVCVAAIATVHILVSGSDQFILNVLRGEGYSFQVVRDVCFMVPDVMHVVVPLWQLKRQRHQSKPIEQRDCVIFGSVVLVGLLTASFL